MKYRIIVKTEKSGKKWFYAQKKKILFWYYLIIVKHYYMDSESIRIKCETLDEIKEYVKKDMENNFEINEKKIIKQEIILYE